MAFGAGSAARGNFVQGSANFGAAEGRFCSRHDARDGKAAFRGGGDVQEAIDMTYYMAGEGRRQFGQTVPSELPNKFAMSVRQSIGDGGSGDSVEFSDGDTVVENDACAGVRKHGGDQAGGGYAAFYIQFGSCAERSRAAARGCKYCDG